MVVSDNGDMEKVLATVISIIYVFTEKFPDKWVFIQGSSPVRTRLYRIIITKYLSLIKKDFFLKCWLNGEWEDFLPNVIYQGFAIKRKKQLITMSTEEKKELTQMEASKRKVQKETPYYVLLEPDPSLNKYINKVLFPKKLDLANKALSLSGAPKI